MHKKVFSILLAIVATLLVAAPTVAADESSPVLAYQGMVKVQGLPFSGNGQFKFAIVSPNGEQTLWSHDGTSTGGNQPTGTPLTIPVQDGVFNALIGDPNSGQVPINPVILKYKQYLYLRTWFSDGQHGFQRLFPDAKLINLTEHTETIGGTPLDLYVDGTNGDDNNNGLTTETAKKTIQAAVDLLPGRLNENVTVHIFPGIYPEEVNLYGISTKNGKVLTLLGDPAWTLASNGTPNVVITGANEPDSTTAVRSYAIIARNCDQVAFKGIHARRGANAGIRVENGKQQIINCLVSNNSGPGIFPRFNSTVEIRGCRARENSTHGFQLMTHVSGDIADCEALLNGLSGFFVQDGSMCSFNNRIVSNNNGYAGIQAWVYSLAYLGTTMTGEIRNNGNAAVNLAYFAHTQRFDATIGVTVAVSNNAGGNLQVQAGASKFSLDDSPERHPETFGFE